MWRRVALGLFVAMTLLYANGAGGHYFVDLLVALPFTLAIYAITREKSAWRLPACQMAFITGVILFVGWLIALRWGISLFLASRTLAWMAVIGTFGISLLLRRNLDRTLDSCELATPPAEVELASLARYFGKSTT
jgi:hypothetical protein